MQSGRLTYQKPDNYGKGVLIGHWFEQLADYVKTPHDFATLYSTDYVSKPRSANDPALVWNQKLRAEGYGSRLIFDHDAPNFLENISTTYDLSFNHIPRQYPEGPNHRHFRSRFLRFEPQQDLANNYGNVTGYGLANNYKEKWRCENPDPRLTLTTHYKDTFIASTREELVRIPMTNPALKKRCNPITWECPGVYKPIPDRCVKID